MKRFLFSALGTLSRWGLLASVVSCGLLARLAQWCEDRLTASVKPQPTTPDEWASFMWKNKCAALSESMIRMGYTPDEIVGMAHIGWHPSEYAGLAEAENALREIAVDVERQIAAAHQKKMGS